MKLFKILSFSFIIFTVSVFCVLVPATDIKAHPGRLDGKGCHTCRTNCSDWGLGDGEYHCHNSSGGYVNSSGQKFDKDGQLISSIPASGDEQPAPQQEEQGPDDTKQNNQINIQEVQQDKLGQNISEEKNIKETSEQINKEIDESLDNVAGESTTTIDNVQNIKELPIEPEINANDDMKNQNDEGSATTGFITLAVVGGGVYYFYKKIKKKSRKKL